jgi:hypothetical protein
MGVGRISPFVALQWVWVYADSELVDLTPDIDAWDECRPATGTSGSCTRPDPLPDGRVAGQDYNNNAVFDQVRETRSRMVIGVQGEYQALTLSASFSFDVVKPADTDGDVPANLTAGDPCSSGFEQDGDVCHFVMPRQWSVAAGIGMTF